MNKYKVGIVGAGGVTELHFKGYREHPKRVEIVAVCDLNFELANAKADQYGVAQRFSNLDDFIRTSRVDVVVVCTPSTVRKPVIFPLIEAGFPLFVEKPFCETLAEAQEIVKKAEKHRVKVCINQNFRRHFPFELVRSLLADDTIGKVNTVIMSHLGFRQDKGWRLASERHALSVMGIHWLDGMRWILGSDPQTIVCQTRSAQTVNCVGETDASVQITFANGAVASYVQSFSSPYRKTELTIIGENGTIGATPNEVYLYRRGAMDPVQTWKHSVSRETATYEGLNRLLVSLETGIEAPNSAKDNLRTVAMLDAAYVSAKDQRIVRLTGGRIE
jgi:predicted dehydrogenase